MPRLLDAHQKAEFASFLDSLYEIGGYTTQSEWARDAGVHETSISKARSRGTDRQIDGYNVLRLIRAVATRLEQEPSATAVMGLRQAEEASSSNLERRLQEVSDLAAENFEILKGQLADVARRLPPEVDQDRTAEDSQ